MTVLEGVLRTEFGELDFFVLRFVKGFPREKGTTLIRGNNVGLCGT